MPPASIFTAIGSFYKRVYAGGAPGDIAMRDKPFLSRLAKQSGFDGYDSSGTYRYAIGYGNAQGLSAAFATAQTNAASSKAVQLGAQRVPLYGVVTIGGEELAAADTRNGSFWDARKRETDMMLDALGEEAEFQLFRDGTGVRGRRASASTNVITLTSAADAKNFRIGMTVAASDQADGSSPRTGTTTVAAVDEDAGTITLTSAAAISAFADNDYLYRAGSLGSTLNMQGLAAHLPLTAPGGSDSFRGINRSVDVRRLAGVRVNDTSTSIEENVGNAAVKIMEVGKKADAVFMSPSNLWNILKRRQSQVVYQGAGGKAGFGFGEAFIETPAGVIAAYSSPLCPENRAYVLTMKTWYLKTLREFPHIINDDGNAALRMTSDDGIEVRARGWGNLVCTEPGANAVVAV
jgi:hypothetical protein